MRQASDQTLSGRENDHEGAFDKTRIRSGRLSDLTRTHDASTSEEIPSEREVLFTSASPLLGSLFLSVLPLAMFIGIESRRMQTCGMA